MKRAIFPLIILCVLSALAYYLPKVVQQTEGFTPLADAMSKDVVTERPPTQEQILEPVPVPLVMETPPVVEASAPDLTPFIEAMANGDHAKAAAYLDIIKASLPEDKVQSLSASINAARKREDEAAKVAMESKVAALAAAKLAEAKMTAAPAASSATDAAVIESLRQLQQAQQETAKMLSALNAKQQKASAMPVQVSAPPTSNSSSIASAQAPLPGSTVLLFGRDSSVLGESEASKLVSVIEAVKNDSSARIEIRGFADKSGDSNYNLSLSKSRATAVQDVFRRAGIANGRISLLSMGSFQAAADLAPEKAAEMRKVEVLIVK
jgi:outer membrane protein OmpA-like peptidoglycan-associated protein